MKKSVVFTGILSLALYTGSAQVNERFEKKDKKDTAKVEQQDPEEIIKEENTSDQEPENIWDRLVWGGNASLSFGTYTFIYVAPSVGYKVTENFIAGTGFIYQYAKLNQVYDYATGTFRDVDGYDDQVYGPKFFANYLFARNFYVGSQFEVLNHDFKYRSSNSPEIHEENMWSPVLFLEAGLRQNIGRKGYAVVGFRANILHDMQSPYAHWLYPVIGVYF